MTSCSYSRYSCTIRHRGATAKRPGLTSNSHHDFPNTRNMVPAKSETTPAAETLSPKSSIDRTSLVATAVEKNPNDTPPTQLILPPEEGLKGWYCVAGAFPTVFGSFGFLNACVLKQRSMMESRPNKTQVSVSSRAMTRCTISPTIRPPISPGLIPSS